MGRIERVDADVLNHIAADYIPVVASIGADRDGNSYNVNADEAAGKVAARLRAHKAIFLTDVDGWLADPGDPGSRISETTVEEVEGALDGVGGGMRPEARSVRRGDPGRRTARPHHRRAPTALAASGAVHGRGNRHQGHAVTVEELRGAGGPLADADVQARGGRVRARRGGAALGRRRQRLPRFLRGARGDQRGALPPADHRGDPRAGGAARRSLEPVLLAAGSEARRATVRVEPRRPRVPVQLGRRGERVRDQARPQECPREGGRATGDRRPRRGVPRPHGGDADRFAEDRPRGPLRPASARICHGAARRPRRARGGGGREHRRGADRADPGRGRRPPDPRAGRRRGPRGLRRLGSTARARRDPDRDGEDRVAVGVGAGGRSTGRDDRGEGARRRAAGGARA